MKNLDFVASPEDPGFPTAEQRAIVEAALRMGERLTAGPVHETPSGIRIIALYVAGVHVADVRDSTPRGEWVDYRTHVPALSAWVYGGKDVRYLFMRDLAPDLAGWSRSAAWILDTFPWKTFEEMKRAFWAAALLGDARGPA